MFRHGSFFSRPPHIEVRVHCEGQEAHFRGGHNSPLPAYQARLTIHSNSDSAMGSTDKLSYSCNVAYTNGDIVGCTLTCNLLLMPLPPRLSMSLCLIRARTGFSCNIYWESLCTIAIHLDNQGALFMASNLVTKNRSNHIDLMLHMIQDYIAKELFKL